MTEVRCAGYDHRRQRRCNRFLGRFEVAHGAILCAKCRTWNTVAIGPTVIQSAQR